MKSHVFSRSVLFACCCLALVLILGPARADAATAQKPPAAKAQPKAKPKVEPRRNTAHIATADPAAVSPAHPASDPLKKGLDDFAKDCIVKMNRQRKPGINHKEVKTQPDGTYIARYMAVDPDSLVTKYNPTKEGNKEVKYIGIMDYHEVEYVCTGKNEKQALAGPFNETNRTPVMELVKYKIKTKKWSY